MSPVRPRFAAWAFALCTTALVGCGDSTGPGAGNLSDPAALSADMQSLQTPFDAPVLESFDIVALSSAGTPTARLVSFMSAMSPRGKVPAAGTTPEYRQGAVFRALRPSLAARPSFAVLPAEALGAVYEWNLGTQQYVEGAAVGPANGVRFLLYAINPLTNLPSDPLDQVGYADFLDESDGATNRLRVRVVGDDAVTYADYVVSGTAGSTVAATAAGFLTNGTRRLDFTAALTASDSEISLDYALQLDQPAVSAQLAIELSFNGESALIQHTFSITRGSETVVLDGTLALVSSGETFTMTASFTVDVNGGRFATISGSSASGTAVSYTMTGPGGRALTAAEREAVQRLFEAPSELDELITLLFDPLDEIFGAYGTSG
ncbi:MAG: hypothetical protein ACREOF_21025 [Gemmatimonadales bacterium]